MTGVLLGAIALSYWALVAALVVRCVRHVPPLRALPPAPARASWPRVSIIVPACDEGAEIEAALRSKLACGYPNLELVAVDDRSQDRTGSILDELAQREPRVRVVHVTHLPEGWLGKLNAMQRGLEASSGEWVLFSDADVWLKQGVLEPIVARAEQEGIGFVGVLPGLDGAGLVLDALLGSFMRYICLLGRMWRANDDRSDVGVGVGAFSMVRRELLAASPGLAYLKMEVADDVALGAMLKAGGARCRLLSGGDGVHLPFFTTLRSAARSWEKFGTVFEFSLWRPALFTLAQLSLDVALAAVALASGGTAAVLGALALGCATAAHLFVARWLGTPVRGALAWPLGALTLGALTLRAAFVTWKRQGIVWRGTLYPRAALLSGRRFRYGRLLPLGSERALIRRD